MLRMPPSSVDAPASTADGGNDAEYVTAPTLSQIIPSMSLLK